MQSGTLVRVLRPDYAAGLIGVIEGSEKGSKRWIVKLEKSLLKDRDRTVRLSLPESDFEVIEVTFKYIIINLIKHWH